MTPSTVAVLSCALILGCFLFSEAISYRGAICCTAVGNHVNKKLLQRVVKSEIQKVDGVCGIPAIVLYTKQKKLCANPKNKNVMKWMESQGGDGKKMNKGVKKRQAKTRKNRRKKKTRAKPSPRLL